MQVIDLLNRIALGCYLPEKIKVFDEVFHLDFERNYVDSEGYTLDDYCLIDYLNDEVEIIEYPKNEIHKHYRLTRDDTGGTCINNKYYRVEETTDEYF